MILRDYQEEIAGQTQLQWAMGHKVVLTQLETGGGKTPVLAKIVEEHTGFICAIAHRDKLVEQLSLTLARCGIRHDLVASEKTKRIIAKKHVKKLGQCFYVPGARCRVASAQTLVKAKGLEKWAQQVTLWIVDECFPAGTIVDGRPIETLRAGDTVTAFNEKTGGFEQKKITRVFKNLAPKYMVRIAFGGHHVIHCTAGHPFWTRRGWVDAIDLTFDDEVLVDGENAHRDSLLGMRPAGRTRGMAGRLFRTAQSGVLRQDLLEGRTFSPQFGNDGADEPPVRFGTYEGPQSDATPRDTREDEPNHDRSRAPAGSTGRQWAESDGRRNNADGDRGRSGLFGADHCPDENTAGVRLSDALQDRRGQFGAENSDRGGREIASVAQSAGTGSPERPVFDWVRLDGVTVYERANNEYAGECLDDGHVYNIEVEDLHTYVADGVVVHNCHHLLRDNLWGRCIDMFSHPQCVGLGLTATPGRPDGKGLGRHKRGCNGGPCEGCNDGFADVMVEGPAMRWLIDEGYLCDYDVACPPSDMRIKEPPKGADGEYTQDQRREAARNSHIVGDVPKHYLHFARGLSGITFCGDIETATSTVAEYRRLGVTAELITGNTDSTIRDQIFDRAEAGTLNQIVAVDVISEGVDIPALQVGSFARLTASIITWRQQLGRLLRPMATDRYKAATTREERLAAIAASAKPRALLIDHVDGFRNPNLGPPDRPRPWSLEPRDKRSKGQDEDDIPMRVCTNPDIVPATGRRCFAPYPRTQRKCPKCQYEPQPQGRATPEQVDGDLQLMDPAALAELQGRVFDPTLTREQFGAGQLGKGARPEWVSRHWTGYRATCDAQEALRITMDAWAGQLHAAGRADWEIQKAHYLMFGIDVLTAQGLQATDALALKERIDRHVNRG